MMNSKKKKVKILIFVLMFSLLIFLSMSSLGQVIDTNSIESTTGRLVRSVMIPSNTEKPTLERIASSKVEDFINIDFLSPRTKFLSSQALTPHSPIIVDGNANFTSHSVFTGYGNETHPYEFRDYFIEAGSSIGINISNTDAYFEIKNVWINGSTISGIIFHNVSNGYLINNTVANNNQYGIYLEETQTNSLTNNIVINNRLDGIRLTSSAYNSLINNSVSYNRYGFYIDSANYNNLSNNKANNNGNDGFRLQSSTHNVLIKNNASNNNQLGFYLRASNSNILSTNIGNNCIHGFSLESSVSNMLNNNTATLNAWYGFYIGIDSFSNITIRRFFI